MSAQNLAFSSARHSNDSVRCRPPQHGFATFANAVLLERAVRFNRKLRESSSSRSFIPHLSWNCQAHLGVPLSTCAALLTRSRLDPPRPLTSDPRSALLVYVTFESELRISTDGGTIVWRSVFGDCVSSGTSSTVDGVARGPSARSTGHAYGGMPRRLLKKCPSTRFQFEERYLPRTASRSASRRRFAHSRALVLSFVVGSISHEPFHIVNGSSREEFAQCNMAGTGRDSAGAVHGTSAPSSGQQQTIPIITENPRSRN
ncbi:hypothetical protein BV898_19093 [Hypsibius exemplaris]|uniref:Uncharacterized protein n=1 Tax=Hypsibius exemplaris TaxID=2072580 RepID=A0A9X6NIX0_HYPEX|nr:hypothetical protein BV898_19093 [Hypsibius exemplaris]